METTNEPIYLIDGTAWIFRAYYSQRPRQTPTGVEINAVYGFNQILKKFIYDFKPVFVAAVFDAGQKTFRNDIFPEYKANRGAPPEDLIPQFDLCKEIAAAHGFNPLALPHYEADDLMASIAIKMQDLKRETVIVSNDKDLRQIVGPHIKMFDSKNGEWVDQEKVFQRMGVRPEQVIDYQALVGDSVDNIPGIKGVGPKAAVALLNSGHTISDIFEKPDLIDELSVRGAASLKLKIQTGKEGFDLSKRLVTLKKDLRDENWNPQALKIKEKSKDLVQEINQRLGFKVA